MRIEDVVGYWITQGREQSGKKQAELGAELGEYLDKPWPRQAVSAAEKGRRAFTAAELVAWAFVLGCTVESLLQPPPGVDKIELDEHRSIDSRLLRSAAATNADLADLVGAVHELRQRWPQLQGVVTEVDDLLEKAVREVWRAARGRGIDVAQEEADARNERQKAKTDARNATFAAQRAEREQQ